MTTTVYYGHHVPTSGTTGQPAAPAIANLIRWASDQLVLVDQKSLDELGSSESTYAIKSSTVPDGVAIPRVRIGRYVKVVDGVKQYNMSIRLTAVQKYTDGAEVDHYKESSFVLAGTTYWESEGLFLRDAAMLFLSLLHLSLDDDTLTDALAPLMEMGITSLVNVGNAYTGSVTS